MGKCNQLTSLPFKELKYIVYFLQFRQVSANTYNMSPAPMGAPPMGASTGLADNI